MRQTWPTTCQILCRKFRFASLCNETIQTGRFYWRLVDSIDANDHGALFVTLAPFKRFMKEHWLQHSSSKRFPSRRVSPTCESSRSALTWKQESSCLCLGGRGGGHKSSSLPFSAPQAPQITLADHLMRIWTLA